MYNTVNIYVYCISDTDLTHIPILIADSNDESSLVSMAQKAKNVLNCVGPVSNYFIQSYYAISIYGIMPYIIRYVLSKVGGQHLLISFWLIDM